MIHPTDEGDLNVSKRTRNPGRQGGGEMERYPPWHTLPRSGGPRNRASGGLRGAPRRDLGESLACESP